MDVRRPRHHRVGRFRGGRLARRSSRPFRRTRFSSSGVIIAELGLVFFLSARVDEALALRRPRPLRRLCGVERRRRSRSSSSPTPASSIASTFIVTAGMFGALAFFGTVTKRSLAGVGQFVFMGLDRARSSHRSSGCSGTASALQFVISIVGVIVFTGLTAWDAQRLKQWAAADAGGSCRVVRGRGRPFALPRLRQPVPLPAALPGRPQELRFPVSPRPPFVGEGLAPLRLAGRQLVAAASVRQRRAAARACAYIPEPEGEWPK